MQGFLDRKRRNLPGRCACAGSPARARSGRSSPFWRCLRPWPRGW